MADLIWIFLKIGLTSFGGPAAHIALMEEEFVHKRQWLSREKFLDLNALTQLIPGPNSTELAIHIGYLRTGWWGFWLAGISFILPAFLIVTAIAASYVQYGTLPEIHDFLKGAQAVVLAVVAFAFARFFQSLVHIQSGRELLTSSFWKQKRNAVVIFVFVMSAYLKTQGLSEISILLNSALITFFVFHRFSTNQTKELASIFLAFLKIGSLLFGSGYVLMSFLQTEFIEKRGWISSQQLLDAITVGQFTPGPVFTTASFIGFLLEGIPGALVATVGIFLPAFVFVALSLFLYERLSKSILFRSLLDGVVAGSLGLLLTTLWILCSLTFQSTSTLVLFVLALFLIRKTRIPTAILIFAGGLCSLLLVKI